MPWARPTSSASWPFGSAGLSLVAEAAHGDDVDRVRRVGLSLGSKALDVEVERLRVAHVVAAPDAVDELHAGQDATGVAEQHLEQLELLERQGHRPALDADGVALDIHAHRSRLERRREQVLRLGETAQHGL